MHFRFTPARLKALVTAVIASLIAAIGVLVVLAAPAQAAETACADSSVTSVLAVPAPPQTTIGAFGGFRVDVEFALDPACPVNPGDSFVVHLPGQFVGQAASFDVTDADGNVIGHAIATGDTLTFTYGDFVATHHDVKGSLFAGTFFSTSMVYNQDVKTTTTVGIQTFHQTLNVPRTTSPWQLAKTCAWTDNTQTRFACDVRLPPGPQTNVHIVDVLGAGASYVINSAYLTQFTGQDANGEPTGEHTIGGMVLSNQSATGFTADIATVAGPFNRIIYHVTPTDTTQATYTNSVEFTSSVQTTKTLTTFINRTVFGGGGSGTNSPAIKIVKKDVAGHDADTPATVVTLPTGSTGLVYTITNTGNEPLNNVTVTDSVVANGVVTALTCDFSPLGGPATGTTWAAGPFAPNASFQCTAQLTGVEPGTTLHEDIGAVTGTGVTSKKVVTDSNPYYATTLYSLGDYVWYDTNHDGIQDATEAPAGGVSVTLRTGAGTTVATTTTDASGRYHFDQLPEADYWVTFTAPAGYQWTQQTAGTDTTKDSNVDPSGATALFHLGPSDANLTDSTAADGVQAPKIDRTIDAGLIVIAVPQITIVKKDVNGNDADTETTAANLGDEPGSTGLTFTITNTGNEALLAVTVTDTVIANGTVTGLWCDFSALGGPATGTTWSGPFAVGASFPCTAQLTGVLSGPVHEDVASVTGTGQYSGTEVNSTNPYFARALLVQQVNGLAYTGAGIEAPLTLAAALMVIGGLAVGVGRRRHRE